MNHIPIMPYDTAYRFVEHVLKDPVIDRRYELCDKLRSNQTKHDKEHGLLVAEQADKIAAHVQLHRPGTLSDFERKVIVRLAAFLHDIGGAADDHDVVGAQFAKDYLMNQVFEGQRLDPKVVNRICRIIGLHRTRKVLKMDFNDPAWAIVVIADKCVGDEDRVRPWRAAVLSILTFIRMSWIPLRKGGVHDRANFAIKNAEIKFSPADMSLALDIDKRVCGPQLIHRLYRDRFRSCVKAANYLDFSFGLVFNGERFEFDENANDWQTTVCY